MDIPSAPRYLLGDALDHLEYALYTHPGFSWHGADRPVPNGRYVIDPDRNTIYLDRAMSGDEAVRAFVDACTELDAAAVYTHRHRVS